MMQDRALAEVLRRARIVNEHRDGKIPVFTLHVGGEGNLVEGVEATQAFAATQHPIRAQIWDAACTEPVSAADLLSRVANIPETTLRRHCNALVSAGILVRNSTDGKVLWLARVSPGEVTASYQSTAHCAAGETVAATLDRAF